MLVHAAPAHLQLTVTGEDDRVVLRGEAGRQDYSPITVLELRPPDGLTRSEIWPAEEHLGLPVLLPGGEGGVLLRWEHAEDRSWWRWAVEFSDHVGRPADWAPEGEDLRR